MELSIVVPVFNEGSGLFEFDRRLNQVMKELDQIYEIIYIDDGSKDNSWEILNRLAANNPQIRLIRFSRNFGQHSAISAGLAYSQGRFTVMMDCDLQDEPEVIPQLYEAIKARPVQIVYVRRRNRKDRMIRRWLSHIFYFLLSKISGYTFDPSIGSFRILSRQAVDAYNSLPETNKFVGGLFFWMGFSYTTIVAEHQPRHKGASTYTLKGRIKLAQTAIFTFSPRLLNIVMYLGLGSFFLSFAIGIGYLVKSLVFQTPVSVGALSLISIYIVGGFILFALSIMAGYIGQILIQVQNRPLFIVEEHVNY